MRRFASLRQRGDFARLRGRGRRTATASLTIYEAGPHAGDGQALVGITVSKAVGGAVVRNLVRRRIAAIIQEIFLAGKPQLRLLIVARPGAARLEYQDLRAELKHALQ